MSHELKTGDRVRVTAQSRVKGYQAGEKGVVVEGATAYAEEGDKSYVVAMDKDGPGAPSAIFKADEIESDV